MNQSFKYGFLLVLLLVLASCNRNTTEVLEQGTVAEGELVLTLDTLSQRQFETFYAKIATSYDDSASSMSFKTSTWMVADSASNFLISYAKIPVVGALVTLDSVHVSNKREKCQMHSSLEFLRQQFGIEFTLKNLQDIILGIPTNFDASRTYYQVGKNNRELCTHGLRDIEQIKLEGSDEIVMYFGLNESLSDLASTTVVSFADSTEINIEYKERELVNGFSVPTSVFVKIISPRKEINVELNYSKMRVNNGEQIHFVIPDTYGECE